MNQSYFETLVVSEQPGKVDETPSAPAAAIAGGHLELIVTTLMAIVFLGASMSWRSERPPATLASTSNQTVAFVLQGTLTDQGQVASPVHPSHRR